MVALHASLEGAQLFAVDIACAVSRRPQNRAVEEVQSPVQQPFIVTEEEGPTARKSLLPAKGDVGKPKEGRLHRVVEVGIFA